jgi:molybdenum cofactor synthesis domain-containing protein
MLASLATHPIFLYPRPRVALIVTGDELAGPEDEVRPGQIRESNSFALRGLVEECGADVVEVRKVGDSVEGLYQAMRDLAGQCEAIVTSGGVSAGDFDPVRDVLREHAEIRFWKVAMKPGKPVMFANFEGAPVFGLPGNPVSVMVAFELFVRPALMKMGGQSRWTRTEVAATSKAPLRSPLGRVEYVRAYVRPGGDGWDADFPGDQGSGRLSTMLAANALLVIPADVEKIQEGDLVRARLLGLPALD